MSDVLVSSATVAPTAPTTAGIAADLDAQDAAGKIKITIRVRPTGG